MSETSTGVICSVPPLNGLLDSFPLNLVLLPSHSPCRCTSTRMHEIQLNAIAGRKIIIGAVSDSWTGPERFSAFVSRFPFILLRVVQCRGREVDPINKMFKNMMARAFLVLTYYGGLDHLSFSASGGRRKSDLDSFLSSLQPCPTQVSCPDGSYGPWQ